MANYKPESFAERLKTARLRANISQMDLSLDTGICQATISQYERGVSTPNVYNLVKIAIAVGMSPNWLVGKDYTTE